MADFNQDTYQPMDGDLYIVEVRTGRFTMYRYSFQSWEQLGAGHSKQDVEALVAPMQFLGESKGFRRYYRPTQAAEALTVEKIAANRYRLRSRGQVMTVDAQALRDLTDWGLLHMCELEQEAKQAQPPAKSYEEIETEIQVIKEEVNSQD